MLYPARLTDFEPSNMPVAFGAYVVWTSHDDSFQRYREDSEEYENYNNLPNCWTSVQLIYPELRLLQRRYYIEHEDNYGRSCNANSNYDILVKLTST